MKAIAAGGPDGLIDPAAWPIRAEDVADTTGYEFAAATLRRITSEIETHALDLGATWKALPGAYQAPELEQALAIMPPVVETATSVSADLAAAAGALEGLATALQGIYPRLADLQARAEAFRSDVAGGVLMERVSGGGAAPGEFLNGLDMVRDVTVVDVAAALVPGVGRFVGTGPEPVPWSQHRAIVARNAELCTEYAVLYEEITTVVAECVNTIDARNPEHTGPALEPLPAGALLDPDHPMPWGAPIAEDRHWVEQLLTGVDDPLRVLVNEGSRLWFGYDIHTGDSGRHVSDETLVETVSGLAEIALALSITVGWSRADPTTRQVIAALTPDPVQRWARDRQVSGMSSLLGLGGFDYAAHVTGGDGLHRWREDGIYTLGSTLTNAGTLASPSALGVAAGLGRASRIARVEAHLAPDVDGRPIVMWRDPDAPPPHTPEERRTPTPGDGEVLFNSRDRALTPREAAELAREQEPERQSRRDHPPLPRRVPAHDLPCPDAGRHDLPTEGRMSTMDQIRWDALIGHAYLARNKLVDIAPHVYAPTVPNLHATPEQLAAAEDRLGHPLDPLLRELLGYANGWPQFLWDTDWLGTDDIGQGPRWQFGLELIDLYYDNYDTDHLPTRDQIYPVLVSAQLDDVMVVRKDGPITKGGHEFIWLAGEAPGERWDNALEWWLACIELTNRGIAWYEQQAAKG